MRKIFHLSIYVFLTMLIIGSSLSAGRNNKDTEECCFLAVVKKCLSCFVRKQAFKGEDEKYLFEENDFLLTPGLLIKRNLKNIPVDDLWEICYKLPASDIIRLSLTCKNLKIRINEDFWKSYLKVHNQKKWCQPIPSIKVAYAFLLFERRQFAKAAKLGHPKAIEIVRKQEAEKEARKRECSPYPSRDAYIRYWYEYDRYEYDRISDFFLRKRYSHGY